MKKALGWMALVVFAAAMVSPVVALCRNDFGYRDARGAYATGRGYNRDHDRGRAHRGHDRDFGYFRR